MAKRRRCSCWSSTRTSRYLGLAAANISSTLNPSKIVIGGGVSAAETSSWMVCARSLKKLIYKYVNLLNWLATLGKCRYYQCCILVFNKMKWSLARAWGLLFFCLLWYNEDNTGFKGVYDKSRYNFKENIRKIMEAGEQARPKYRMVERPTQVHHGSLYGVWSLKGEFPIWPFVPSRLNQPSKRCSGSTRISQISRPVEDKYNVHYWNDWEVGIVVLLVNAMVLWSKSMTLPIKSSNN